MIFLLARLAVFAVGLSLGAASYAQTSPPSAPSGTPAAKDTLNQEDKTFVKEAGIGGMAEVELSKLAQKSENADVKKFADRMVQDHTKANQELTTVATGLGIDLPKALDQEHEQMRQKLAALHGKAFDEQYMKGMVEDHNKAVTAFQQEERSGSSAQLKSFAQKTLPTLQEHQKMAFELSRKVTQASAR
jgi:putative membrane protein